MLVDADAPAGPRPPPGFGRGPRCAVPSKTALDRDGTEEPLLSTTTDQPGTAEGKPGSLPSPELDRAVIRFAGDSGDGMQLTGTRFTSVSSLFGNDTATMPDFPAEIRAPAGTLAGSLHSRSTSPTTTY